MDGQGSHLLGGARVGDQPVPGPDGQLLGWVALRDLAHDQSGGDGVAADAGPAVAGGDGPGELVQCGLRRAVGHLYDVAVEPGGGRDVQDRAAAGPPQVGKGELGGEEGSAQVDVERAVPRRHRGRLGVDVGGDDLRLESGRVVAEDVEPAEPLDRLVDGRAHRRLVGDVGLKDDGLAARRSDRLGRRRRAGPVQVDAGHRRSFGRRGEGDRPSDPLRRTGDQYGSSLQALHARTSPSPGTDAAPRRRPGRRYHFFDAVSVVSLPSAGRFPEVGTVRARAARTAAASGSRERHPKTTVSESTISTVGVRFIGAMVGSVFVTPL